MGVRFLTGEVAPLVPLVVPLAEIAACLFVIGCIYVLRGFLKALLGSLGSITSVIPFIGGVSSSLIHKAEREVTDALGEAESYFDARIGGAFHMAARLVDWTYRELRRHANLLELVATLALGPAAVGAIRAALAVLHGNVHSLTHRVTDTYARVLRLEHRLQHTLTAGVLPRLGRLEREYDRVIDRDIAGLRAKVKTAEDTATKAWDYVRSHPWTVVTDAFVAAVAVALTRLGLGWTRCPTAKQVFDRRGCRMWSDLDGLLAAALGIAATMSLVELAEAEKEVIGDISSVVRRFWQV